jgi:hypothetical protein
MTPASLVTSEKSSGVSESLKDSALAKANPALKVYLGAPIDTALSNPEAHFAALVELVQTVVPEAICFNPLRAFAMVKPCVSAMGFVRDINMYALDSAGLAVFKVTDCPSFGVPIEIERCRVSNKPAIVWYEASKKPGLYLHTMCQGSKVVLCTSKQEVLEVLTDLTR